MKPETQAMHDASADIADRIAEIRNQKTSPELNFVLRADCPVCFAVRGVPCFGPSTRPCLDRIIRASNSMKEQAELWTTSEHRRRPKGVV